jgi:hypothetical protein
MKTFNVSFEFHWAVGIWIAYDREEKELAICLPFCCLMIH